MTYGTLGILALKTRDGGLKRSFTTGELYPLTVLYTAQEVKQTDCTSMTKNSLQK